MRLLLTNAIVRCWPEGHRYEGVGYRAGFGLGLIEARGERVVAAEIYVVEGGCVASPAWGVAFFYPHYMRGGAHLHAALA